MRVHNSVYSHRQQRATPVAFSLVLHLSGTLCLVHVSLHPMIFHRLRGMSIPTFSSTECLHVYVFFLVALNLERLEALFCATCIKKFKKIGLLWSWQCSPFKLFAWCSLFPPRPWPKLAAAATTRVVYWERIYSISFHFIYYAWSCGVLTGILQQTTAKGHR